MKSSTKAPYRSSVSLSFFLSLCSSILYISLPLSLSSSLFLLPLCICPPLCIPPPISVFPLSLYSPSSLCIPPPLYVFPLLFLYSPSSLCIPPLSIPIFSLPLPQSFSIISPLSLPLSLPISLFLLSSPVLLYIFLCPLILGNRAEIKWNISVIFVVLEHPLKFVTSIAKQPVHIVLFTDLAERSWTSATVQFFYLPCNSFACCSPLGIAHSSCIIIFDSGVVATKKPQYVSRLITS